MNAALKKMILQRVRKVPLLSQSAVRLIELMGKTDVGMAEIVQVVSCDAILTAKVLQAVNSAAMGLNMPVETVNRAVSYLGQKMVVGIALSVCSDRFFVKALAGYEGRSGALWEHSMMAAIMAREISRHSIRPVSADLAFTAGIVHDIGKSVLSDFLSSGARSLVQSVEEGTHSDFLAAEASDTGLDHTVIGRELAVHWKLPQALTTVIEHHHQPASAPEEARPLCWVVHLGDILAMMAGKATGADAMMYVLDPEYEKTIPIQQEAIEALMADAMIEFEKAAAMLAGENKGNQS